MKIGNRQENKMIKILSLFSGIGAFEKALTKLKIPYEIINYCEIDKYAAKAYSLIHNISENMNLKDIRTINTANLPRDIDLITYGFPCQDISNMGLRKGFTDEKGKVTRSGLFFEALRIIESIRPKMAIAENVKALTGKKFKSEFKLVLDSLNAAGYINYWSVLNAKDYGIPQNRERVFIISIRKDINNGYFFPQKYELKLKLKDLLESNVDKKFYLSNKMFESFIKNNSKQKQNGNGFRFQLTDVNGVAKSVTTKAGQRNTDNFICVKEATKKGFSEARPGDYVNLKFPESKTRRGRVGKSIAQTLICTDQNGVVTNDFKIRKLTPKECFRLMGFSDSDINVLIEYGFSNTQLYKMAGNSIVVDVLESIFKELANQYKNIFEINFVDRRTNEHNIQLTIFDFIGG